LPQTLKALLVCTGPRKVAVLVSHVPDAFKSMSAQRA